MRVIAKITALIFMIFGLILLLLGAGFAISGIPQYQSGIASSMFGITGILLLVNLVGGLVIGLQGLFLAAIGEGLWLLAGIYEQTTYTSDLLFRITRRSQETSR